MSEEKTSRVVIRFTYTEATSRRDEDVIEVDEPSHGVWTVAVGFEGGPAIYEGRGDSREEALQRTLEDLLRDNMDFQAKYEANRLKFEEGSGDPASHEAHRVVRFMLCDECDAVFPPPDNFQLLLEEQLNRLASQP